MDREKVIKGLECCLGKGQKRGMCEDCPYDTNAGRMKCNLGDMHVDALALLQAQEPRLVHVAANINHRKIGECPNCGKLINSGDYMNFCGQCGQAVKWE